VGLPRPRQPGLEGVELGGQGGGLWRRPGSGRASAP
jgi:hypothetical protein